MLTAFSILCLLINADSTLSDTDETESLPASISLCLYTGQTTDEFKEVTIGHALDLMDDVDIWKQTVLYIHGWRDSPDMISVQTVVDAYLKRQDHNVMVVDWSKIAARHYFRVFSSTARVGSAIAEGLNNLVAAGLDQSTLHIVGHSLGSHIAGFIGRNVNFTLPRIIGLDPAGPGFYFLVDDLSSADAQFVVVIHTDAAVSGTVSNRGNVSFFPNGGFRFQPGCPMFEILPTLDEFCDHRRSWVYYAESVLNEYAFIGVKCNCYILFQLGLCNSNPRAVMGYGTPTTASGKFFLRTNSESPFGKGTNGV